MTPSKHAEARLRQRGYRLSDLDLIECFGTHTRDGYVMTKYDVHRATSQLKSLIQRIEANKGRALIVREDTIITGYRPDKKQRRRMLEHQ